MGLFPRPRAARSAADGAQPPAAPPRRATRFAEGWNHPSPWRETYPGKHNPPRTTSREMRPARPAGGGRPQFCGLPGVHPLRPALEHSARNIEFRCLSRQLSGLTCLAQRYPLPRRGRCRRSRRRGNFFPAPGEVPRFARRRGTQPARVLRNHF